LGGLLRSALGTLGALALLPLAAAAAHAGATELVEPACGGDCGALIERVLAAEEARIFPLLTLPAERFEPAGACAEPRTAESTVHAVVLAPFYTDFIKLPGTQNDAKLLKDLFEKRGVPAANLQVLDGDKVTRDRMIEALHAVVPCVRERDQVIVTFSGGATSYRKWRAPYLDAFMKLLCEREGGAASADPDTKILCSLDPAEFEELHKAAAARHDEHVLFSSEAIVSAHEYNGLRPDDKVTGLRAAELSNFASQIRNRGADVIFILDTNYAQDFRLLSQQQAASFDTAWTWTRGDGEDADAERSDVVDLFGNGAMAALYAASSDQMAAESRQTGGLALGELTFAISEALHSEQSPTILQLSREIDRVMAEKAVRQVPVFEATNPELRFLATRSAPQANPNDIDILEPSLKRGSITPAVPEARVAARYNGPGRPAFAAIDGVNLEIGADGTFERNVTPGGRTEIPIRVYGRDASLLSERRLLFGQDETEAQLATVGRRLALIIANDNYMDETSFPTLQNPIRDGEALAALLQENFGFSTKLDLGGGKERDLIVRNATKSEVETVLFDLRKRLTADDQLIVYYAGHGEIDDEETAYWVPVDGEGGTDITWIESRRISDELRRINAGSVLLISDSCYAGGLSRSAKSLKDEEAPRDRYLANASRFKSRQLIASGGNEPVEDGGGQGHSLFARALLEAMEEMPEKVFTASELFEGKLKPKVLERSFATGTGQTPGHYRMAHVGDEPSSEFIFRRQ
jgi:hypothetical protein